MAYFTSSKDLIDLRRFAGYPIIPGDALDAQALETALAALDETSGGIIKNTFLAVLRDREAKLNAANTLLHVTVDEDTEFNPDQMALRRQEIAVLAVAMCDALGVTPGLALRASLRGNQGRNGKLVL